MSRTFLFVFLFFFSCNLSLQSEKNFDEIFRLLDENPDPSGALPYLTPGDYVNKGVESMIGDLPIYSVGTAKNGAIIFIYDIYGFNAGHTRQFVDNLATLGYLVILPDVYRGDNATKTGFSIDNYTWDKVKKDIVAVEDYIKTNGNTTKILMAGTCYGGYITFEASKEMTLIAGLTYHPAGGRVNSLATLGTDTKNPLLIIATKQEDAMLKEGGSIQQALQSRFDNKSVFKTYENMNHGFVVRGDLADPATKTAVDQVMDITYKFIESVNPNFSSFMSLSVLSLLAVFLLIN